MSVCTFEKKKKKKGRRLLKPKQFCPRDKHKLKSAGISLALSSHCDDGLLGAQGIHNDSQFIEAVYNGITVDDK